MAASNKFGTFKGVFTPSILTILGVIMYMRLPMIVGEAGLFATIGIIVIAHIISASTSLSVSSIATDKKVKAGGTYYMISRSLGLPIGGTLGLALFVGLSFSVSLYLIGFAESFLGYWGFELDINNIRLVGSAMLLLVTIITFISTSLALKTQYFIMAAIGLSLLSIFFGQHDFTPEKPIFSNPESTIPLMVLFGIFFPAVTGFEAGVSMSGDLKDPKKSIPMGAMAAVIVGFVSYIGLAFFFSYTVDGETLAQDPKVLLKIAWLPELVLAGIWGATLSSALGSILGAPRILQATALDKITPRIFAKGTGQANEPRNALILTFLIAEAGILIGELDIIARIVSIFFITTYGFLNLSAAFERMTSADFRPTFKPPVWISLIGAIACIIVMIQLDFVAMIGASAILLLLYLYLKRKELVLQTGDTWGSLWASLVKKGLNRLNKETIEARNWRPNILMFSGKEDNRPYLVELGKDITNRFGILTGFELKVSNAKFLPRKGHSNTEGFFMNTLGCRDIYEGMDEVVRVYGFSGVEPNTVLMGWNKNQEHQQQFIRFVQRLAKNDLNALFIHHRKEQGFGKYQQIDVWWSGWGNNLSFAITLLRHLTSSSNWKDAKLRLLAITNEAAMPERLKNSMAKIIEEYRLAMEIKVIDNSVNKLGIKEIIWRESEKADLTIVGISGKNIEEIGRNFENSNELIEKLGSVLILRASSDFTAHDLVQEMHSGKLVGIARKDILLPDLVPTKYENINSKVAKIDTWGLSITNQLFEKAFSPSYLYYWQFIDDVKCLVETVLSNIERIKEQDAKHKKAKVWLKAKNDFYYQCATIVNKHTSEKLEQVKAQLFEGIGWYHDELERKIGRAEKKIVVPFVKKEFVPRKKDAGYLKWLKIRKRLYSPFSKKTINTSHDFRKILNFYIKENGFQYLNHALASFNHFGLGAIASLRDIVSQVDAELKVIQKQIFEPNFPADKFDALKQGLVLSFEELEKSNQDEQNKLKNNLLLDFRNNLQLFSNDLAKINANHLVRKKRRKGKYYQLLKEQNLSFYGNWADDVSLYSNLIRLDLQVLSLQFRLNQELLDYRAKFHQQLETGLLQKIDKFIGLIEEQTDYKKTPELDVDSDFLQQNDFSETLHKGIENIVESVPENILVADLRKASEVLPGKDKLVPLSVPLKRIASHYINYLLGNIIEVDLKIASDEIKRAIFGLKDHLSYMYFGLENLEEGHGSREDKFFVIKQELVKELGQEENKIKHIRDNFETNILKNSEKLFEALSPHNIASSSKEVLQTTRMIKPEKAGNYLDSLIEDVHRGIKSFVLKILYSQSEGVLLARELNAKARQRSFSEQMLDLLDEIEPGSKIYDAIPAYYKNLFSERSSINEDFWVERPLEQNLFKKAWGHYQAGHHGAIMVLGERNSGKTAFCKYSTKKYCAGKTVYHVFPPSNGSAELKVFNKTLNHVPNLSGSIDEVFEKLPHQTVLVFNDLELWWESSEDGLKVVMELLRLIGQYGYKCFFVLNMNPYAYQNIKGKIDVENYLISTIHCQSFDSEELKELIIKRHRSSGLKMGFGKSHEESMSEIRLAGIFNKYFNYSEGNPGLALYTWLASVKKQVGNKLSLAVPQKPGFALFGKINETWLVVLGQLVVHKRMDVEKLTRVLHIDKDEIEKNISAMLMAGLVKEKTSGLYIINPVIDKFLSKYLLEKGYV